MSKLGGRKPSRNSDEGGVARLLDALETICPSRLAAEWDNVGLIAGSLDWPARRCMLAIDLTDAVAREALRRRVDGLVVYHPPIFKGIKSISLFADGPTTLLPDLLAARITIVSVHTALDNAIGGTNDALLDCFDIVERHPLQSEVRKQQYKLAVFVPPAHVDALRKALAEAGAGVIGGYHECSFSTPGRGSFRGDESTHPTIGQPQQLEFVEEVRLEMIFSAAHVQRIVRTLYANHPYEEPAFDLYPVHTVQERGMVGSGRVGRLRTPQTGRALLNRLRGSVDLSVATIIGNLDRKFKFVVAAAGSFGVERLCRGQSLAITGELKHHDALQVVRNEGTVICLGHDRSERPGLARLRERLVKALPGVRFELSKADISPMQAVTR